MPLSQEADQLLKQRNEHTRDAESEPKGKCSDVHAAVFMVVV